MFTLEQHPALRRADRERSCAARPCPREPMGLGELCRLCQERYDRVAESKHSRRCDCADCHWWTVVYARVTGGKP